MTLDAIHSVISRAAANEARGWPEYLGVAYAEYQDGTTYRLIINPPCGAETFIAADLITQQARIWIDGVESIGNPSWN